MSREFSPLEQRLMKSLIKLDSCDSLNVLGNMIEEYLEDYYYISVKSSSDVNVQLKKSVTIDIQELIAYCSDLAVTIVTLFDYLKSQGFVHFSGHYKCTVLGEKIENEPYCQCDFINSDLREAIFNSTTQKFYLFESFRVFVKNGFKTTAELNRNNELSATKLQLKYTQIALTLSFFGLLASIFIPLLTTSSISIKNDTIQVGYDSKTAEQFHKLSKEEVSLLVTPLTLVLEEEIKNKDASIKIQLNSMQQQVDRLQGELSKIKLNTPKNKKT